jgi:tetratricopeptide (TPR) repeat protein
MRRWLVPTVIAITCGMLGVAWWRDAARTTGDAAEESRALASSRMGVVNTTRADIEQSISRLEARLAERAADGAAVVQLAELLIRVQRIDSDAAAVVTAEQRLRQFLSRNPDHYDAQRTLGPVLLSQHRFRDALREAERARALDPRDAYNYAVIGDARREFERAAFTFPKHPYAMTGLAQVKEAEQDHAGALALYQEMFAATATPELAFVIGDLHAKAGRAAAAESMYVEGERLEREGWATEEPQPQALARFLAERDRNIPEAVSLAEQAAARRSDIHTMDALAWAYFKAGRLDEAFRASERALRTGTRDARILSHAVAIRERMGDVQSAKALKARAASN